MVDIEAILKQRRAELSALLKKYSPRFRELGFHIHYVKYNNVLQLYSDNASQNWLSFDIIEPLQMFCNMYYLLWLVAIDPVDKRLKVVITLDTNVKYFYLPKNRTKELN